MKVFQYITKVAKGVFIPIILLAASSCTKEDNSMCDLYLKFRYDYNMASEDLFSKQVEQVKVFIFDTAGKYVNCICENGEALKGAGYRIKIPYEMYGYTIIVWAGHTEPFYTIPEMEVGDPVEKLTLQYKPEGNTCQQKIDDLWHSGPIVMAFNEENSTTQTVSLLRNTNDINVQLTDKNGTTRTGEFKIKITSPNGAYNHKDQYMPGNPVISYHPYGYSEISGSKAQLRSLRLIEGDQAMLTVTNQEGKPVNIGGMTAINLVDYLLKSTPAGMGTQEYLDRCYLWDISLIIENSQVMSITINGWVHWFHYVET